MGDAPIGMGIYSDPEREYLRDAEELMEMAESQIEHMDTDTYKVGGATYSRALFYKSGQKLVLRDNIDGNSSIDEEEREFTVSNLQEMYNKLIGPEYTRFKALKTFNEVMGDRVENIAAALEQ